VEHAPGYTRYSGVAGAELAHEAGFDAFMTGACFAALLPLSAASDAAQAAAAVEAPSVRIVVPPITNVRACERCTMRGWFSALCSRPAR
jgi:hypothetical protein